MILGLLDESMTGAELYSKLFDKPLRLVKNKDKDAKEKEKDPDVQAEPKVSAALLDIVDAVYQKWENIRSATKNKNLQKAMDYVEQVALAERITSKLVDKILKEIKKTGRFRISEGYVITRNNPISIKEIIANWTNGVQPAPNDQYDMMATLDDVLEYRDMSPQPLQLSIEEMEDLKRDLKQTGLTDSVVIEVGKNGQAAIAGGNQMIELAKHLNIQEIPVSFVFKDHVQKASKVTAEPAEIRKSAEDQGEVPVYGQSMQSRGTSLDV